MVNYIILATIVVQATIIGALWFFWGHRQLQTVRTYPLYEVRDKLINLVASGKLKEDDPIFKEFYKSINIIIGNSKKFTLYRLVLALEYAREKGLDPAEEEKLEQITELILKTDDEEIRDAFLSFYESVFNLILKNSPVLRLAWWLKLTLHSIPVVTKRHKTTVNVFSRYNNARSAMLCAA